MPSFNKVILAGHMTRDPELRHTPGGASVCDFGLAVNRTWKDRDGQKQEDVCFVDCTAWAKTGEVISQYFKKGKPILLEGRLQLDQWQDKESGANRSKIKVVVEQFTFIDGGGEQGQANSKPAAKRVEMDDDDIPF